MRMGPMLRPFLRFVCAKAVAMQSTGYRLRTHPQRSTACFDTPKMLCNPATARFAYLNHSATISAILRRTHEKCKFLVSHLFSSLLKKIKKNHVPDLNTLYGI